MSTHEENLHDALDTSKQQACQANVTQPISIQNVRYFRKKPVHVTAEPFHEKTYTISPFLRQHIRDRAVFNEKWETCTAADGRYYIQQENGQLTVSENDMVIQNQQGDIYPCKPDIFEQTYEPITE